MTPDRYTNQAFMLDVGDGHQLYVYDWGTPDAELPIIFLHGGPGSSISDGYKQRFDPRKQRLVFFDQRGAGKSLPKGELKNNTADTLTDDIETLRKHLKLSKVLITGGSWGSTLGLLYGIRYPKAVAGMVLSGIYTATKDEADYLDKGIFKTHYPDVWQAYLDRTPESERADPSRYHYAQAFGDDPEKAKASIYAYSELESSLLHLDDRHTAQDYDTFDPNNMRIELQYLRNHCFIKEHFILDNTARLTMPIWLVQGRYDMVCPPIMAFRLHQKLPRSELIWVTAGHGNDRANYDVIRTLLLQLGGQL